LLLLLLLSEFIKALPLKPRAAHYSPPNTSAANSTAAFAAAAPRTILPLEKKKKRSIGFAGHRGSQCKSRVSSYTSYAGRIIRITEETPKTTKTHRSEKQVDVNASLQGFAVDCHHRCKTSLFERQASSFFFFF
jgi:hypothetical protein